MWKTSRNIDRTLIHCVSCKSLGDDLYLGCESANAVPSSHAVRGAVPFQIAPSCLVSIFSWDPECQAISDLLFLEHILSPLQPFVHPFGGTSYPNVGRNYSLWIRMRVCFDKLVTNSSAKLTRSIGFSGYRETEKQSRQRVFASVPQI